MGDPRKLTQEQISAIRNLANSGVTQKEISRRLGVSRWAANEYSKGINSPKRISEETIKQVVMLLENTESSYAAVGKIVGINPKSVARIAKRYELRTYRIEELQTRKRKNKITPPRPMNQRYAVLIHNVVGMEGLEAYKEFDHVPLYWDLRHMCAENKIRADDFANDKNTDFNDKLVFGECYYNGQGKIAARFTIERLQGEAADYYIYDGMDKDIWSNAE